MDSCKNDLEIQTRQDVIGSKRLIVAALFPELYRALLAVEGDPSEGNEARFQEELLKIKEHKRWRSCIKFLARTEQQKARC